MGGSHSSSADGSSSGKELSSSGHQHDQHGEPDIYPLVIKKEPEDLTRRNLRQHVHQHHPDSRIVCSSNNGDSNKVDGGVATGTVISRVMADGELVHEMIPRLESISHVMSGASNNNNSDARDGGPNPSSSSVIHIRRPISSQQQQSQQQHDGDSMMSPGVLDLARAGIQSAIQQQYSPSAYSSNSGAIGNGHQQSGLASIQAVGNHGYDSSPGPAYGLVSPNEPGAYTAIHPSSSSRSQQQPSGYTVSSSVATGDSFYRDYFTTTSSSNTNTNNASVNSEQQYARAVAQMAYSTGGEVHESGFVDRFIRTQAGVYKQQQQGTGLTVDLPSPDSGIGVDAVTPRDQSVAQQVENPPPSFDFHTTNNCLNFSCPLQNFDYTELCHPGLIGEPAIEHQSSEQQHHNNSAHGGSDEGSRTPTSGGEHSKSSMSPGSGHLNSSRSRSWHDCNRQSEVDKIQIPKV